jgi:hypothetical protein
MNIRCAVDSYDREMSTYIVAYLDILGVASRMKQKTDTQTEALNKLYNLYTFIMELADGEAGIKKYANIKFRIFSDNIILAQELSTDKKKRRAEIECLLGCVSNFACSAVGDSVGWLLRGGITIGEFYINDTIVWGPALLRAYELEDSIANYPRIALDTSILNELNHHRKNTDFISLDFDGVSYLNYMSIWHFSGAIVKNGFELMKAEARKPYGTYSDRVYQKLYWHMEYVNRELNRKDERKDRYYRLSL